LWFYELPLFVPLLYVVISGCFFFFSSFCSSSSFCRNMFVFPRRLATDAKPSRQISERLNTCFHVCIMHVFLCLRCWRADIQTLLPLPDASAFERHSSVLCDDAEPAGFANAVRGTSVTWDNVLEIHDCLNDGDTDELYRMLNKCDKEQRTQLLQLWVAWTPTWASDLSDATTRIGGDTQYLGDSDILGPLMETEGFAALFTIKDLTAVVGTLYGDEHVPWINVDAAYALLVPSCVGEDEDEYPTTVANAKQLRALLAEAPLLEATVKDALFSLHRWSRLYLSDDNLNYVATKDEQAAALQLARSKAERDGELREQPRVKSGGKHMGGNGSKGVGAPARSRTEFRIDEVKVAATTAAKALPEWYKLVAEANVDFNEKDPDDGFAAAFNAARAAIHATAEWKAMKALEDASWNMTFHVDEEKEEKHGEKRKRDVV
jgi:hypothetical protein